MRIFVMIAAYRDPEIMWTVNDAVAKATFPDCLSFGICWQGNLEDDRWIDGLQWIPNCRVVKVLASESDGCCWARSITQSLWQKEEYTLQIDSHSRFIQDWDSKLIAMLRVCNSPKSILTTYPASYIFPDALDPFAKPYRIGANYFTPHGVLELQATNEIQSNVPVVGYFLSAGVIFGSSEWIQESPYDDKLYFNGEESSLAMRFWTNGWEIFHPNEVAIYHNYQRHNAPRHQSEYTNVTRELASYARYRDVMTGEVTDKFGAGKMRSLAEYEQACGVNFKQQVIKESSKTGVFVSG